MIVIIGLMISDNDVCSVYNYINGSDGVTIVIMLMITTLMVVVG